MKQEFDGKLSKPAPSGKFLRGSLTFLLVAALVSACVTEPNPITGKRRAYGFSWAQEQQLGRETDKEVVQEFGLYNDPKVQAYVQRVGQGVLQKSDLRDANAPELYRNTPFTFRVLDSPVVNAFAVPGGYVYITRGLLTHLENEAQLAVVLGHEVAHVAARHSARQALKAQVGQLGMLGGAILGGTVLGDPQMAQQVLGAASQALQLLTLKHSRDDEREADLLGVGYAAHRGYQVAEGAEFFNSLKRLGAKDGVRLPAWASTHPDPGEREQTIIQLGKKYQQTKGLAVLGEDELLSSIQGMVVGENPREGFTQNGVFYHPEMKFQFAVPQGWKVRNEKSAVLLTAPNRNAAMVLELARAGSAREAASQFAGQQGFQVIESGPARLRGLDAYQVVGQAQTQQGTAGIVNYFIEHEGRVFSFMGLTGASNLRQQQAAFERAVSGFRKVTDPKVLQVRPMRLQIVTTDRTAPFSSFLPTSATPGITPEELAILNQVTLNEQIPAGRKLKLPR